MAKATIEIELEDVIEDAIDNMDAQDIHKLIYYAVEALIKKDISFETIIQGIIDDRPAS